MMDWSQAAGAFVVGGDSKELLIWDATTESKADVSLLLFYICRLVIFSCGTLDSVNSIEQSIDHCDR